MDVYFQSVTKYIIELNLIEPDLFHHNNSSLAYLHDQTIWLGRQCEQSNYNEL